VELSESYQDFLASIYLTYLFPWEEVRCTCGGPGESECTCREANKATEAERQKWLAGEGSREEREYRGCDV
jgi:hypothetical protein